MKKPKSRIHAAMLPVRKKNRRGSMRYTLTPTQQTVLSVLDSYAYQSPRQIAERADMNNWGGVARSLHALMIRGLVERMQIGKQGRWILWGWRKRNSADVGVR